MAFLYHASRCLVVNRVIGTEPFAEDVVSPNLIDEDNGHQHEGGHGHDG